MAHAHSAQDREGKLRADAADVVDEEAEEVALRRGHEAVKNVRVFADMEMRQDLHRLTGGGKFIVAGKRDENFVADATDIHNRLGGQGRREIAVEKRDHPSQSLASDAGNPKNQ